MKFTQGTAESVVVRNRIGEVLFSLDSPGYMELMPGGSVRITDGVEELLIDLEGAAQVALHGALYALLGPQAITGDGTLLGAVFDELDKYSMGRFVLIVSGKSLSVGSTVDVFLRYSPDEGGTWDDFYRFTQITDALVGNGTYVAYKNAGASQDEADRIVANLTLAAHTFRAGTWCDRLRVDVVSAGLTPGDSVTLEVLGYLQ